MITLFNRNTNEKIAYLDDVIIEDTIQITRKINGEFTLSFEILEDDLKTIYLDSEGYILCDGYYFDIKYIEKEHSDTLTYRIECEHVSYRLIENEVEYYTFDGTPSQILTDILSGTEFSVDDIDSTAITTFAVYEETNKLRLVQKLANLLELEVDYDGFTISLKNTIGENSGFPAIFGKNLKGIRKIIDRRTNLTYYDIDLVELKNHPDYVDFKDLETVGVGDTIRIIDKVMNIDISNKVIRRSYNPIKAMNSKLEIANSIELLTDKVTKIQRDTIAKGKTYHGIRISPDTGFESIRSDKMARGIFNSDTFALQSGDGSGNNWLNKLYFDPLAGKYIFDGVLSSGSIISDTAIIRALYANTGRIAKLTVDQVETSNKIERYLNGNTEDMYYQKIFEQNLQFIEASVLFDGENPLEEHLTDREGNELYWLDETYEAITLEITVYPVKIYQYDEGIKMQISFQLDPETGYNIPIIQLGEGDGVTDLSSKAFIRKGQTGIEMSYYESSTGKKRKLSISDSGIVIDSGGDYLKGQTARNIHVSDIPPAAEDGDVGDVFFETGDPEISDSEGAELVGGGDTTLHTHPESAITDLDKYTQAEVDSLVATYTHNQSTASSLWIVSHNLGKFPSVAVVDSAGSVVIGEISYLDGNSISISFSGAFSGKAYLN